RTHRPRSARPIDQPAASRTGLLGTVNVGLAGDFPRLCTNLWTAGAAAPDTPAQPRPASCQHRWVRATIAPRWIQQTLAPRMPTWAESSMILRCTCRLCCIALLAGWVSALAQAGRAFAHDWYPLECCAERDCAPADTVVRREDGSYLVTSRGLS